MEHSGVSGLLIAEVEYQNQLQKIDNAITISQDVICFTSGNNTTTGRLGKPNHPC
jgi:hypothetical protein